MLATNRAPEVGQDVAIRRILPFDDEEITYAIEWGMEPQFGTPADAPPERQNPAKRMIAAKRARRTGVSGRGRSGNKSRRRTYKLGDPGPGRRFKVAQRSVFVTAEGVHRRSVGFSCLERN
jgi:hypothetical protein